MGFLFPTAEEEAAEVLSLVRRIVASGWDREWASDEGGNQVDEWSEEAVNFSLLAALSKAQDVSDGVVDSVVICRVGSCIMGTVASDSTGPENLYEWNSSPKRTPEDVLNVIDKAMERLKEGLHAW